MICTCVHSAGVIIGCHICRPENFIKEEHPDEPYPYTSWEVRNDWRNYSRDLQKETYEDQLKKISIFLLDVNKSLRKFGEDNKSSQIVKDFCENFKHDIHNSSSMHCMHKQLRQARQTIKILKSNKRICKKCQSTELANDDIDYCKMCKEF
jgi:hypothetical protein